VSAVNERPVHLIVNDDEIRSRLTVFFRALLAIPHLLWLSLWGVAVFFAVIINWFATLIAGRSPTAIHNFLASYLRYAIHVGAYLFLAANPFPGFTGEPGYPVDVDIAPPQPQNRWTVLFRMLLAIPALLLGSLLAGQLASAGLLRFGTGYSAGLLVSTAAFLGWFASLARGRMPRGLRDAAAYAIAYAAQLDAYIFLLTDRYPNSDPLGALEEIPVRTDPIRLQTDEAGLQRSRLTVFFRLLLVLPHLVWLYLWSILAYLAAIVNWFATLIGGRSPDGLHRFLAAYVRYMTHVYAYLYLTANPFPGFTGQEGSYPVDLSIDGPRTQNRWTVAFRIVLAIPALIVAAVYGYLAGVAAFLGWFAALFTARMPRGLRNAQALALRYSAQTYGYLFLLSESYPYSGPSLNAAPVADVPDLAPPVPMPV
jgi:hypothetical protein